MTCTCAAVVCFCFFYLDLLQNHAIVTSRCRHKRFARSFFILGPMVHFPFPFPSFWSQARHSRQSVLPLSLKKNFLYGRGYLHGCTVAGCCCRLNNTRVCDEHLFGQVSTCTGHYQLPIFRCTNVHLRRCARPLFRRAVFS